MVRGFHHSSQAVCLQPVLQVFVVVVVVVFGQVRVRMCVCDCCERVDWCLGVCSIDEWIGNRETGTVTKDV